jgi:hypothetical protein
VPFVERRRLVKAVPAKGFALISNENGSPYSSAALGHFMKEAIKAAGLPGKCCPHGLRKASMRRLAEAGKTEKETAAVSGHKTLREVAVTQRQPINVAWLGLQ